MVDEAGKISFCFGVDDEGGVFWASHITKSIVIKARFLTFSSCYDSCVLSDISQCGKIATCKHSISQSIVNVTDVDVIAMRIEYGLMSASPGP